jgi:chemotaxis signal transduction protein
MDDPVELVVFQVGEGRFGADLTQVARIDSKDPSRSVGEPLGAPGEGARALVFYGPDGQEHRLELAALLGVRSLQPAELRRLPPSAQVSSAIPIGAWLDGERTVLLVDLQAMVKG